MDQAELAFTAVFLKGKHGYTGFVEELPGVNSQGQTREELLDNLSDALEEALEMRRGSRGGDILPRRWGSRTSKCAGDVRGRGTLPRRHNSLNMSLLSHAKGGTVPPCHSQQLRERAFFPAPPENATF